MAPVLCARDSAFSAPVSRPAVRWLSASLSLPAIEDARDLLPHQSTRRVVIGKVGSVGGRIQSGLGRLVPYPQQMEEHLAYGVKNIASVTYCTTV